MTWSDSYPAQRLAPADPRWAEQYAALAAGLTATLGPAWVLEHVGSTSVPGLPAKPVIDLAVRVPPGTHLGDASAGFTDAGWTAPRDLGDHAASFLLEEGRRVGIAHVFTAAQWPEAHVRLFAAWLREHPTDRDRYAALKVDLVREGAWESGGYTGAKADFVLEVVNRARTALGLPVHPGPL